MFGKTICKWCGDRRGGCVYCYEEVKKLEQAKTERIRDWQPPPQELIDMLETGVVPEGLGWEASLHVTLIRAKMEMMTEKERKDFIASMMLPPPNFQANTNDETDMEILKKHFQRETIIGDIEGNITPEKRGEMARIEQVMKHKIKF